VGRDNLTQAALPGYPLPAAPIIGLAATRLKDAYGADEVGRATPGPLTRAVRSHEPGHLRRKRGARGQFATPANCAAGAKQQVKPRLTPARSFRDEWTPDSALIGE